MLKHSNYSNDIEETINNMGRTYGMILNLLVTYSLRYLFDIVARISEVVSNGAGSIEIIKK